MFLLPVVEKQPEKRVTATADGKAHAALFDPLNSRQEADSTSNVPKSDPFSNIGKSLPFILPCSLI